MRNQAEERDWQEDRLQAIYENIRHMHGTLSAEDYFNALEGMIDDARQTIQAIEDPSAKEDYRDFYSQVIDYAMNLKLGIETCP